MKVGDRAGNRQSDSNLLAVQPEAPGQLEGVQPLSPPRLSPEYEEKASTSDLSYQGPEGDVSGPWERSGLPQG